MLAIVTLYSEEPAEFVLEGNAVLCHRLVICFPDQCDIAGIRGL